VCVRGGAGLPNLSGIVNKHIAGSDGRLITSCAMRSANEMTLRSGELKRYLAEFSGYRNRDVNGIRTSTRESLYEPRRMLGNKRTG